MATPDWLEGLIANKDSLVAKLESLGCLERAFILDVENDVGAGIDAVTKAMNEIERLEDQRKSSEDDSVAVLAREFLKEHGVILDDELKTAVEAPKTVNTTQAGGSGWPHTQQQSQIWRNPYRRRP